MAGELLKWDGELRGGLEPSARMTITRRGGCDGTLIEMKEGDGIAFEGPSPSGPADGVVLAVNQDELLVEVGNQTIAFRPADRLEVSIRTPGIVAQNWIVKRGR